MQDRHLDLETTGLCAESDEILEIGIVDAQGCTLLSSLVRPVRTESWPSAQAINGITPEMVKDAPTLAQLMPQILVLVTDCNVIAYNAAFDFAFLPEVVEAAADIQCCMLKFAEFFGAWDECRNSYKWQKLAFAADYVGFEWPRTAHRADVDALACRAVWAFLHDKEAQEAKEKTRFNEQNERAARAILRKEAARAEYDDREKSRAMTDFLNVWYFRRYGITKHWLHDVRASEREKVIADVFFGLPLEAVKHGVSEIYTIKKEIPDHLKPLNFFGVKKWVKDELAQHSPSAVFVSSSGKRKWPLYHVDILEELKAQYPLRFVEPNSAHKTASQLLYQGYTKDEIAQLTPVRSDQNGFSGIWYNLYLIKKGN